MEKTRVSVTLTRPYLDALDRLVEEGIYLTKGEIIQEALRQKILDCQRHFYVEATRMRKDPKPQGNMRPDWSTAASFKEFLYSDELRRIFDIFSRLPPDQQREYLAGVSEIGKDFTGPSIDWQVILEELIALADEYSKYL